MTRLRFSSSKAIDAIDYIARSKPGITQYYICKIIFFADREHLLDYGRSITGDRFVAMQYGPVPSNVWNVLKVDQNQPPELLDIVTSRVETVKNGNQISYSSKNASDFPNLSGSDKQYLDDAINLYGNMTFGELCDLSHQDVAYEDAWLRIGSDANEMNIDLWLDTLENPASAKAQIGETAQSLA